MSLLENSTFIEILKETVIFVTHVARPRVYVVINFHGIAKLQ
jgi:hypothetical protein